MMNLIIQTASRHPEDIEAFYHKLGFEKKEVDGIVRFYSSGLIIEINSNKFARTGLVLDVSKAKMAEVINKYFSVEVEDGCIVDSPSGTRVTLVNGDAMPQENPSSKSILGNYCGISIETVNLASSMSFWADLGFKPTMGGADKGWVSMENQNKAVISLMAINNCPHTFTNPSMTFFNGKENPGIIAKIRSLDIIIAEEITEFNDKGEVDNVVIRDPSGLGMFIFNDEV